jgi:hypothetical protein
MKHLTIIVPGGQNNLGSIVGVYKIFTRANTCRRENGRKELFTTHLAGISNESAKRAFETSRKTINEVMYEVLVIRM